MHRTFTPHRALKAAHLHYNNPVRRLLILVLCLTLFAGCKTDTKTASERIEESTSAAETKMPKDPKDAEVFTRLKTAGHDFQKPTKATFYLYFPEEGAARGALQVLSADGYTGKITQGDSKWLCELQKDMVLTADTIEMERFKFRDMTVNAGGEYEGWDAPPVK